MSEMTQTDMFDRNKYIQEMVDTFLSVNHMPTIAEMMGNSGKIQTPGVLTPSHKIILQQMIRREYPDIDDRIRSASNSPDGRGQILGVLSSTEASLVDELLANYLSNIEFTQQVRVPTK